MKIAKQLSLTFLTFFTLLGSLLVASPSEAAPISIVSQAQGKNPIYLECHRKGTEYPQSGIGSIQHQAKGGFIHCADIGHIQFCLSKESKSHKPGIGPSNNPSLWIICEHSNQPQQRHNIREKWSIKFQRSGLDHDNTLVVVPLHVPDEGYSAK